MSANHWKKIDHFSRNDNFGDPSKMHFELIQNLDYLRAYINRPIIIHCGYEPRDGLGFHPLGLAVDCHAENMHCIQFYIAATRFGFNGIGIYPWWNKPGLHLDMRPLKPKDHRALWASTGPKKYVAFDAEFLRLTMLDRGAFS